MLKSRHFILLFGSDCLPQTDRGPRGRDRQEDALMFEEVESDGAQTEDGGDGGVGEIAGT